jgi:hypothetical protein
MNKILNQVQDDKPDLRPLTKPNLIGKIPKITLFGGHIEC